MGRAIRRLAAVENRALVVVTHDERIFQYADRTARMDDGRIVNVASGRVVDLAVD